MDLTKLFGGIDLKAIETKALEAKEKQEAMLKELKDINSKQDAIINLLQKIADKA